MWKVLRDDFLQEVQEILATSRFGVRKLLPSAWLKGADIPG